MAQKSYRFNQSAAQHLIIPDLYVGREINKEFWHDLNSGYVSTVDVYVDGALFSSLCSVMDYEELQRIHPDVADFLIEVDGWSFRNYSKVRFIFWDERDNSVDIIYPDWQWRKAA